MSTNSIFILKPIWDALYEDAKRDREEMDALKKRLEACNEAHMNEYKREIEELKAKVKTLEEYNRELHLENNTLKSCAYHDPFVVDDAAYAAEASAPPCNQVEEKSVHDVIIAEAPVVPVVEEPVEESTKTVKMIGTKTKQEYQREYQRNYRKKQKNITMNL